MTKNQLAQRLLDDDFITAFYSLALQHGENDTQALTPEDLGELKKEWNIWVEHSNIPGLDFEVYRSCNFVYIKIIDMVKDGLAASRSLSDARIKLAIWEHKKEKQSSLRAAEVEYLNGLETAKNKVVPSRYYENLRKLKENRIKEARASAVRDIVYQSTEFVSTTVILTSEYTDEEYTKAREECITLDDVGRELVRLGINPIPIEQMHEVVNYDY